MPSGRASGPTKKTFEAPYMGINHALPEHQIPATALWAAYNCMFHRGRVTTRLSMVPVSTATGANAPSFDSRPLGCWSVKTSDGDHDIFVSTHENFYRLRNFTGSWTDVSGSLTLTNDDTHTPRFASLYNAETEEVVTVMVNNVDDNTYSLDGGDFDTILVGARKGYDITTAASRFVAVEKPYYIWWSDLYSYNFPALNFYAALDTPGEVIAIRNLGAMGVVVYKDDAIVVGYSQPGTPAKAFRFETRFEVPGPAGASAVVVAEGRHFMMTTTGRIGVFDGTRFDWIGDGVWDFLGGSFGQSGDFDRAHATQTHGFYDESFGQVWFVYPRVDDNGDGPTGIIIVTLPRPAWGVPSYGMWGGNFMHPASCSNTVKLSGGNVGLVMRSDAGNEDAEGILNPYLYGTFGDDGEEFDCFLQTGLQPTGEVIKVEIEAFLQKGEDFGSCTVRPVIAYTLGTDGGFVAGTPQTIDLEAAEPVHEVRGFNAAGRFVGLRLDWTSRVPSSPGPEDGGQVIYKGALISGYPLEAP